MNAGDCRRADMRQTPVAHLAEDGLALITEAQEQRDNQEKALNRATRLGKTPWGCRFIPNGWTPQFFSALDLSLPPRAAALFSAGVERRRAADQRRVQSPDSSRQAQSTGCGALLSSLDNNTTRENNRHTAQALGRPPGSASVANCVSYASVKPHLAIDKSDARLTGGASA